MHRTKIMPADADIVSRLRAHAARMVEDHATANNGQGFATEAWERTDLENILDQAADEIERIRAALTFCANHADDMPRVVKTAVEALGEQSS